MNKQIQEEKAKCKARLQEFSPAFKALADKQAARLPAIVRLSVPLLLLSVLMPWHLDQKP